MLAGSGHGYMDILSLLFKKMTLINLAFFQTPQHEYKDKKMKVFSSGSVSMDVNIEKTGFVQGESSPGDVDMMLSLTPRIVLIFLV